PRASTPAPSLPLIEMPGCSRASTASFLTAVKAMPAKAGLGSLGSVRRPPHRIGDVVADGISQVQHVAAHAHATFDGEFYAGGGRRHCGLASVSKPSSPGRQTPQAF